MERYKRLKEAGHTEHVPYDVYGKGDLEHFLKFFVEYYNKMFKVNAHPNDIGLDFHEDHAQEHRDIHTFFANRLQTVFKVSFHDKKSKTILIDGELYITTQYAHGMNHPETDVHYVASLHSPASFNLL